MEETYEFTNKDIIFYFGLLILWILIGTFLLLQINRILSLFYIALWFITYITNRYLVCTKCCYYGKKCYMFGGKCSYLLYKKRGGNYTFFETGVVVVGWFLLTLFPLPFLLIYKLWSWLIIYLIVAVGWQVLHKKNVCDKCLNVKCSMNPRHKNAL